MAKHIMQLRRGWKYTDSNGKIIRDDWAKYEEDKDTNPNYLAPRAGELVVEYDNGIPRLKIGDGEKHFSQLEYMSVDSFILPTPAYITVYANKWIEVTDEDGNIIENRYYQEVDVKNAAITPRSKVDLQIDPADLVIFHEKDIAFTTVNEGGTVRVCLVGQKPANDYTLQATVTEVVINE